MKHCKKCNQTKPFEDFGKRLDGKYFRSYCRKCEQNIKNASRDKQKDREYQRRYRVENKGKILEYKKTEKYKETRKRLEREYKRRTAERLSDTYVVKLLKEKNKHIALFK